MTNTDREDINQLAIDYLKQSDKIQKLKETLSNVLLAYSKQRKEFNIPIKPESIIDAENLLKQLK